MSGRAPPQRPGSLQARLLGWQLGLVLAVWLVAVVATWLDARHELDELLDSHLAQAAAMLVVQQTRPGHDDDPSVPEAPSLHRYASRTAFQVFHEGRLQMHSANAGAAPLSTHPRGFATVKGPDGQDWRVFAAQGAEADVRVLVGEQLDSRQDILRAVLRGTVFPLALALPALALGGWWVVRRGLRPLRDLSRALQQRAPHHTEPVQLPNPPREIQPVVLALNGLLARMAALMAAERRFTADAAHELRTPLAALRAQAQVALRARGDPQTQDHALHATLAACDRATRLVSQLLTLARLEQSMAAEALGQGPALDLCTLVREVAAEAAPAALERGQDLALTAPAHAVVVAGDDTLLRVLVRNLVDNALRYSPDGASVSLVLQGAQGGRGAVLTVDDGGPGLSEADRARLGERFFRVLGTAQAGSGLGWSIVQRVAQAHGLVLQVDRSASLGGLSVSVQWPTPA